jgi:hypothetical protein
MNSEVPFSTANNWSEYPELQRHVAWHSASCGEPHIEFEAVVSGCQWLVRINDFPDEPLYTLLIDRTDIIHFDDWPEFWGTRPAFSLNDSIKANVA